MNDNEQQGSELGFFCCKGVQNWVNGPVSKFPKNIKVEEIVNKSDQRRLQGNIGRRLQQTKINKCRAINRQ